MGLGGFLKGIFGGGDKSGGGEDEPKRGEAVAYKDFQIIPAPMRQGGQFLTSGFIAKDFPEGRKEYRFVRADTDVLHACGETRRACEPRVTGLALSLPDHGQRLSSARGAPAQPSTSRSPRICSLIGTFPVEPPAQH